MAAAKCTAPAAMVQPQCVESPHDNGRRAQVDLLERIDQTKLPFAELLGIEFISASEDKIVAQMMVREDLCTSPAIAHGGVIMAFADTLGAMGTIVNLPKAQGRRLSRAKQISSPRRRSERG